MSPGSSSGADPGPGRGARDRGDIRRRIERLRRESQRAHSLLARHEDPAFLLRRLVSETLRWTSDLARGFLAGRGPGSRPAAGGSGQSSEPCRIRIRQPLETGRPGILHAVANVATGGSARLVADLFEHLGHSYRQEVLTRDLASGVGYEGWPLHHRPSFRHPGQVADLLRRTSTEILHVHFLGHHGNAYADRDWRWYDAVFCGARRAGCAVVQNINVPVEPYVDEAVDRYVYVSDYVRSRFGVPDAPEVTLHPGSDLDLFSRDAEPPDDCIGMVYRLERDKLDEEAVDALIEAIRRRPGTRALVVGGGSLLRTYRERVAAAGVSDAFTFTGYVPFEELPGLYRRMSVFVAPVHTESFGQVVPFAMGMELPVVGYNVGGLPELLGNAAHLAPPGDAVGLAARILRMLEDRGERLRIGALNRKRAVERFSLPAMIRGYAQLYDDLSGAARACRAECRPGGRR